MGNVTHDVLHHARCPVTVVPADGSHARSTDSDAPKTTIGSILALIDFSDVTPAVMAETERLARAFDCRVMLAHVEPPAPLAVDFAPPPGPDTVAEAEHEALSRLGESLRQCGLAETTRVSRGQVLDSALRLAKELAPDLIIMGSHGHGALYNLFVGSVTSGVLRQVTCPVVVVPAVGRR
jgi:nucleotide-binding universal stress UspA family protein